QRKEYSKAEPVLKKAAELGTRIAPIHYHLGMTYYRLGRKEDAIASLKRSLQLDGQFSEADEARRVLRGLGASGRRAKAETDFELLRTWAARAATNAGLTESCRNVPGSIGR